MTYVTEKRARASWTQGRQFSASVKQPDRQENIPWWGGGSAGDDDGRKGSQPERISTEEHEESVRQSEGAPQENKPWWAQ